MPTYPLGTILNGKLKLLQLLGAGADGEVYLAEHLDLTKKFAIKVYSGNLNSSSAKAFRTEAQRVAALAEDSDYILPVHDFFVTADGRPVIVMEYAPNGSLREVYDRVFALKKTMSFDDALEWLSPVAEALSTAHNQQIIHRDIKPDNILIGRRNHVYLADFGLASVLGSTLTQDLSNAKRGTPEYASPEQFKGQAGILGDLYSFGVIVFEALAGRTPFEGNLAELFKQHTFADPPVELLPSTISARTKAVFTKVLAKDPTQRYPSIQEFMYALNQSIQAPSSVSIVSKPTVSIPTRSSAQQSATGLITVLTISTLRDEKYGQKFETSLTGHLVAQQDVQLQPTLYIAKNTDGQIATGIANSDIVLLLTSASFLSDMYGRTAIVNALQSKKVNPNTKIIIVYLSACSWSWPGTVSVFDGLEVLPDTNKQLTATRWDTGVAKTATGINRVIADIRKLRGYATPKPTTRIQSGLTTVLPQTTGICPRCATPVAGNAQFCMNCGSQVGGTIQPTAKTIYVAYSGVKLDEKPSIACMHNLLAAGHTVHNMREFHVRRGSLPEEVREFYDRSDLTILLLSTDFLVTYKQRNSPYSEGLAALAQVLGPQDIAKCLAVVVRPCGFQGFFQPMPNIYSPTETKSVADIKDKDTFWTNFAQAIKYMPKK